VARNLGGQAHGNAAGPVQQHEGQAGGQLPGLGGRSVVVRDEFDRAFVDFIEQQPRDGRQPRLGVAHGRSAIAVARAEVALPVDERVALRKILRHADHRVVGGGVPVGVIAAQNIAHHARALHRPWPRRRGEGQAHALHGVQDAPLHRLLAVAHIRQRAAFHHAECIFEVGAFGIVRQRHRIGGLAAGRRLKEIGSGIHLRIVARPLPALPWCGRLDSLRHLPAASELAVRLLATHLSAGMAAAFLCATAVAETQTLSYADFSDVSALQINGNASQQGAKLQLTQALGFQSGSAFSSTPVTLSADASFSSFFTFEILARSGLGNGADGLVFAVQTASSTVGGAGGGLGFAGIPRSLGVEFDTYDNGEAGGSNHVGIDLNGSVDSVASTGQLDPDFDNGEKWYAWVDYDGTADLLQVRWSSAAIRPLTPGLSLVVDLPGVLGSSDAFVGFTAGTGAGVGEHNILSWAFVNEFVPDGVTPAVPEPATQALMWLGLAATALAAERRRRG